MEGLQQSMEGFVMCEACDLTEKNPNSGRYNADCPECNARAIACGIAVFEASQEGKVTPRLKDLLIRVYGDNWQDGLKLVNKWRERSKE